jgi:hypothetical protein
MVDCGRAVKKRLNFWTKRNSTIQDEIDSTLRKPLLYPAELRDQLFNFKMAAL